MMISNETIIPLGDNLYVTLDQTKQNIQIRKYIASLTSPSNICLTPTKEGLTLFSQQFQPLKENLSILMSHIFANNENILIRHYPNELEPIPLGNNIYLSTTCFNGEIKVHIRRCIPMKMLYWSFDVTYEPEKLQPTTTGIMLTTQQTINLFQQMGTIQLLLNSTLPISSSQISSPPEVSSPEVSSPEVTPTSTKIDSVDCCRDLFDYVFNDAQLSNDDQQQQEEPQDKLLKMVEQELIVDEQMPDLSNNIVNYMDLPNDNQQSQFHSDMDNVTSFQDLFDLIQLDGEKEENINNDKEKEDLYNYLFNYTDQSDNNQQPQPQKNDQEILTRQKKSRYLIRTSYNLRGGEK